MVDPTVPRRNVVSNILVRLFAFVVLIFFAQYAYILTVKNTSCDSCFSAGISTTSGDGVYINFAADKTQLLDFYTALFQTLIAEGYLHSHSKSLCLEPHNGEEITALRQIGVADSIGVAKKPSPPLILLGHAIRQPFDDNTFDFEFSGFSVLESSGEPVKFALEVSRTLKTGGIFVVHTKSIDSYSLNSLLDLFSCCILIDSREINGPHSLRIREIVLLKQSEILGHVNKCSIQHYKRELIGYSEPLIDEEPLKPWITLKRNVRNIRYISSMVDISFKNRYIYVDVGARKYGSSIGGWFNKRYPKQNKTFKIYAIESDKAFHEGYKLKKRVTLLPYAAWVRNESLFFELNREPLRKSVEKSRGMGRIQAVHSTSDFVSNFDKIKGFDFAIWLKNTVSRRDFVVVKMDVEGTEFYLIPRLVETGAICLIDEIFLECHYNRWQRCCPGVRSPKYQNTYAQCLDLFSTLREIGVVVHQWW